MRIKRGSCNVRTHLDRVCAHGLRAFVVCRATAHGLCAWPSMSMWQAYVWCAWPAWACLGGMLSLHLCLVQCLRVRVHMHGSACLPQATSSMWWETLFWCVGLVHRNWHEQIWCIGDRTSACGSDQNRTSRTHLGHAKLLVSAVCMLGPCLAHAVYYGWCMPECDAWCVMVMAAWVSLGIWLQSTRCQQLSKQSPLLSSLFRHAAM